MKILMIGISPPEQGGSQRHIYEIASRLGADLLTQKRSNYRGNKIEVPTINKSVFSRNISFAKFSFPRILELLFRKKSKKYDVIHIHENLLYFFIPLLRLRYKVVTTVHGCKGFNFFDNKFLWQIYKFFLKFSNAIIAVSKEDEKILSEYFKKVDYIPNGVDNSVYAFNSKQEKKICFIGRIHEQKGIVYLLEAFDKIKEKIPGFKLELIGKGERDYEDGLKKKFNDKRIIWRGFVSNRKEIAKSLKSSYLICLPSLWEGLPLTLFEALASTRPVICSDLKVFRTIVNDKSARFVRAKSSDDVAKAILFLIGNKKKAEQIGKEGKKIALKYDWNEIAKETLKTYQNLEK